MRRQRLFHDGRLHEFLHIVPQHGRRAGHESCHDHQEVPRAVLMTVGGVWYGMVRKMVFRRDLLKNYPGNFFKNSTNLCNLM